MVVLARVAAYLRGRVEAHNRGADLERGGGMGFGALNEVVEFIATITLPSTNVGGYVNTGWDLVFNLFGCVAAAAMIRFRVGR